MCVSPVVVFNPYFRSEAWQYHKGAVKPLDSRFVSQKRHIEVPCGRCEECRASYYSALRQRAQVESLTSYVYFVTLTYDDKHIPFLQFSNGRRRRGRNISLYFSDFTHLQSMVKRMRNDSLFENRSFRYIAVTEYGTCRFRPHFHCLFFISKLPGDSYATALSLEQQLSKCILKNYALNIGTRKNPVYEPLFTYAENPATGESNYRCTVVRDYEMDPNDPRSINSPESIAKSVNYLISYISKPSQYDSILEDSFLNLSGYIPADVFRKLSRVLKTRVVYSKHFGFGFYDDGSAVRPHLRSCSVTRDRRELRDLYASLPDPIDETIEYSPDDFLPDDFESFRESLLHPDNVFLISKDYRGCSIGRFLNKELSDSDYFYAHLLRSREPRAFASWCKQVHLSSDTYSPNLLPITAYDSRFESSASYRYIRHSVNSGIKHRSNFLSFEFVDHGCVKFVPLCKYYRRYCCDFDDVARLYKSLGVADFDSYISMIEPSSVDSVNRRKSLYAAHEILHDQKRSRYYELNEDYRKIVKSKILSIFAPVGSTISAVCGS